MDSRHYFLASILRKKRVWRCRPIQRIYHRRRTLTGWGRWQHVCILLGACCESFWLNGYSSHRSSNYWWCFWVSDRCHLRWNIVCGLVPAWSWNCKVETVRVLWVDRWSDWKGLFLRKDTQIKLCVLWENEERSLVLVWVRVVFMVIFGLAFRGRLHFMNTPCFII